MDVLSQHAQCEVLPSENSDVFILVTDTEDWKEERALHSFLSEQEELLCLALTYGQVDGEGPKKEMPSRLIEAEVGMPRQPEGEV